MSSERLKEREGEREKHESKLFGKKSNNSKTDA